MMKVLHLCLANFYADNLGYQENLITKYHKKENFDVTIIASCIDYDSRRGAWVLVSPSEYVNRDGVRVKRIQYKYGRNGLLSRVGKLLRMYDKTLVHIENEEPDVIFIHGAQFWDVKQVIQYKRDNPEVKIYADNHADFINSARNLLSRYILHGIIWKHHIRRLEPFCEKFWGVTPNRCDFLRDVYGISEHKIDLLPMCADTERVNLKSKDIIRRGIRQKHSLDDHDFVLISGGKIDERKNIHNLIRAVNKLANPNIKLLLFGVPTEEMKDEITSLSDTEYVRNVGWIDSNSVYDYYLASDLGVFPGTHSVLWEQAVGTGLPCIFKKWNGMTHVDVGGNCIFVDDGKVNTIKECIQDVFDDKSKYEEMRSVAVTRGVKFFSYEQIARVSIGYPECSASTV